MNNSHKAKQDIKFNHIAIKIIDEDKFINNIYILNIYLAIISYERLNSIMNMKMIFFYLFLL